MFLNIPFYFQLPRFHFAKIIINYKDTIQKIIQVAIIGMFKKI